MSMSRQRNQPEVTPLVRKEGRKTLEAGPEMDRAILSSRRDALYTSPFSLRAHRLAIEIECACCACSRTGLVYLFATEMGI